ncbi:hypothetical protein HELRODRAFT_178133 [Helobdella robusta]|uniref:Apple domain-containing protein n=1 Tax=Helobdella robusta TaxID=6412 RepID=T1FCT3_HELRO|nr:hypothetical protein HELRODRAFT_178133 [Helobdella robusta]ESN97348.1 hypothetical protein HELRODRAFT_178133 [Helobdella robusta]
MIMKIFLMSYLIENAIMRNLFLPIKNYYGLRTCVKDVSDFEFVFRYDSVMKCLSKCSTVENCIGCNYQLGLRRCSLFINQTKLATRHDVAESCAFYQTLRHICRDRISIGKDGASVHARGSTHSRIMNNYSKPLSLEENEENKFFTTTEYFGFIFCDVEEKKISTETGTAEIAKAFSSKILNAGFINDIGKFVGTFMDDLTKKSLLELPWKPPADYKMPHSLHKKKN